MALPTPEIQAFVLEGLADLVARGGPEPLARAPLEPTPAWFPDRWTGDLPSVRRLARRMLSYAGLESLDAEVALWSDRLPGPRPTEPQVHRGAVARFYGIEAGRAWFAVEAGLLADPARVTAAMAHEVSHAWRSAFEAQVADGDEEHLTDLTSVYLGFGLLTAAAAHRFVSTFDWTQHSYLGYLGPEALCFALAAQAVVRGEDRAARRRLAGHLPPNQAGAFEEAWALLSRDAARVHATVGGPLRLERPLPAPSAPEEPAGAAHAEPVDPLPALETGWNRGKPVFRVPPPIGGAAGGRILGYGILGAVGGAFAMRWGAPFQTALLAGLGSGALVGAWRGRQYARSLADLCSDCGAELVRSAEGCPRCGGRISGTIRHEDDRLEAAERLRAGLPPAVAPRQGLRLPWKVLGTVAALLVLVGWATGLRLHHLKGGPTVEAGCFYDGFLGSRCAPDDSLSFRVSGASGPVYLAAWVEADGSAERFWLFPDENGACPDVSKPIGTVLHVRMGGIPEGEYRVVSGLYGRVPSRAEVELGGGAELDRDEARIEVSSRYRSALQPARREIRMARPGDTGGGTR